MQKEEINVLLDQMCEDIACLEVSKNSNINKEFIADLAKLVEVDNILDYVIDKMKTQEVPYLDELLCYFVNIDGISLSEKQMKKLISITKKPHIYSEEDIIYCIIQSVDTKLSKAIIRKIASSLQYGAEEFFSNYIDLLWNNIFKDDITEDQKEEARRIYEETKDWFFDEGWL